MSHGMLASNLKPLMHCPTSWLGEMDLMPVISLLSQIIHNAIDMLLPTKFESESESDFGGSEDLMKVEPFHWNRLVEILVQDLL
ncbi:hypothetical protein KY289_019627 [Solanum tuberosum]|nr:hypothetical protein KY289_019627 [Solanum tuberosum]